MDTSDKYIKMCDCPEVQKGWTPEAGDWVNHKYDPCSPDDPAHGGYIESVIYHIINPNEHPVDSIWLPRQDQIQGMMYTLAINEVTENGKSSVACPDVIVLDLKEFSEKDCEYGLDTMEQLWLAFYMHEKHSKIWDGEKWVEKK